MKGNLPIIFTHFGNNDYLKYTLKQAKMSNPSKDLFLLGDSSNKIVAIENGWEHVMLKDLTSKKRDEFNARFYWVKGPRHNPVKGGKDWLRFVSERFFAIETFLIERDINIFWHFDSDTMILEDLRTFEDRLINADIECTTLCNGFCPGGFVRRQFIINYSSSMIEDYKDDKFLSEQQYEFSNLNKDYAFTEMRAFIRYLEKSKSPKPPRMCSFFEDQSIWFDDCICQDHNFQTAIGEKGSAILFKNLFFNKDGIFCRRKKTGVPFKFATVNCSWVSNKVFVWVQNAHSLKSGTKVFIKDHVRMPIGHIIFYLLKRKLKSIIRKMRL